MFELGLVAGAAAGICAQSGRDIGAAGASGIGRMTGRNIGAAIAATIGECPAHSIEAAIANGTAAGIGECPGRNVTAADPACIRLSAGSDIRAFVAAGIGKITGRNILTRETCSGVAAGIGFKAARDIGAGDTAGVGLSPVAVLMLPSPPAEAFEPMATLALALAAVPPEPSADDPIAILKLDSPCALAVLPIATLEPLLPFACAEFPIATLKLFVTEEAFACPPMATLMLESPFAPA